jgi:flagellar biosynthesis chaperone FliJ
MSKEQVIDALTRLQQELSRLEPAVEHIEAAQKVTTAVAEIPELYQKYGVALKDRIEESLEASEKVNRGLQSITNSLLDEIDKERKALEELRKQVKDFHDKIELINFPQRLDKIDVSVAGIMSAVQTLQNRVDNLERTFSEKSQLQLQAVQKLQEETGQKFRVVQKFLLGILIVAILSIILIAINIFLL